LIGSPESQPKLTRQRFEECLQNRALADALTFSYWGGTRNQVRFPEVFTAGFLCGPGRLRTLTAGHALYSDDKPVLEYASAQYQINSSDTLIRLVTMLKEVLDPPGSITPHDTQDTLYKKSPAIREQNLRNILAVEYFKRYLTTKDPNALSMAYALNPSNLGIILELGLVHGRNNDLQNAERMFQTILDFDTTHSQAYNNLGLLRLEKGDLGEAMRLYALSIRYDSSNTNAYLNMGVAWMQAKNMKEASRSFEKALQINPNSEDAQEMLLTLKRRGF
jgi:tetratricopeptide (TPR) repeat protein